MAMDENALKNMQSTLDSLLKQSNLEDVTTESTGFEQLPDGYYLSEVEKAELKLSKTSKMPMAALQFRVVDDGVDAEIDSVGNVHLKELKKTKGRKIFLYWVLKDESSVKRFVSDMLKFEGEVAGESLLPKEAFTTSATLEDALSCLEGMRIYTHVSTSEKDDGSSQTWTNMISWKRAAALELPCD